MRFNRLEIHHLRNLAHAELVLGPALNYFHGANGAGKTAVLEAAHLLARGRSFRSAQVADVIQRGEESLTVHASVADEHRGEQRIGLSRWRGGRAELRINGETGRRLSQVAELLPLQMLGPGLSELVFGAPSERRQWLDWGLFHVEHSYLGALRGYLHALRQRNAALKAISQGQLRESDLAVWTDEVGRLGDEVTDQRRSYLHALAPLIQETVEELAPGLEVEIAYRPGWTEDTPLAKVLGDSVPREVKSGTTQSGPHRADVEFRVAGSPVGSTLSRGQGKALASAMMLGQARLLQRTAARASVFLIDDIGAELDLQHSQRFFGILSALGAQILATSNSGPESLQDLPDIQMQTFHVEHGRVAAG